MNYKLLIFILTGLSGQLLAQTNKGQDITFTVKAEKTVVSIFPEKSWMLTGETRNITIRIKPEGRKIAKVTFKGGEITGKDSTYTITAGSGLEGILSVYEKTSSGSKLILNKIYKFKKTTIKLSCKGVRSDSVIDINSLILLGKIKAKIEETKTELKVLNFQMITAMDDTLNSKGDGFTKEMKKELGKLKDGSAVYFYNIECEMPDKVVRKIPTFRLFISEAVGMKQIGM